MKKTQKKEYETYLYMPGTRYEKIVKRLVRVTPNPKKRKP